MRPRFIDESRLLGTAKRTLSTSEGKLRLWHLERYKPFEGIPFEDRTLGSLLEEFYMSIAAGIEQLSGREDLSTDEIDHLHRLEDILDRKLGDRKALSGLSAEESEEFWKTPRSTGDPLADYWEYRLANGLPPNYDLDEPPPRSEWDDE